MKNKISTLFSLAYLFIAGTGISQPLVAPISQASQCYNSAGNFANGMVLSSPPGSTNFTWKALSPPGASCTSMTTALAPNGSNVGFTFPCCGVYSITCMAFNATGMPTGSFNSTVTISCLSLTLTSQPASSVICGGSTATLTAAGAPNYTWLPGNGNTATYTVAPAANTCYTVIGGNATNCTTQAVSCVTVQPLNLSISASSQTICKGATATFTASGASTYTWNTTVNTTTITVSPTVTTGYTVSGSSGNCSGSQSITLNVSGSPTISVSSSTTMLCKGKTATLTANGGATYTWSGSAATAGSLAITPTATTIYTITGKNSADCYGFTTHTQSVTTCAGTGVGLNELSGVQHRLSIFPNPGNSVFTISSSMPGTIEIADALGRQVFSAGLHEGTLEADLTGLPAGLYYVTQKESGQVMKLVKLANR